MGSNSGLALCGPASLQSQKIRDGRALGLGQAVASSPKDLHKEFGMTTIFLVTHDTDEGFKN